VLLATSGLPDTPVMALAGFNKLTVSFRTLKPVSHSTAFCELRGYITVFTGVKYWPYPGPVKSISHLHIMFFRELLSH
jgi:hypothetical protein